MKFFTLIQGVDNVKNVYLEREGLRLKELSLESFVRK